MKFERKKLELPTGVAVFYTHEASDSLDDLEPFQLIANRQGVRISGISPTLETNADLQMFAKTLSDAWADHKKLLPKITSPGGH